MKFSTKGYIIVGEILIVIFIAVQIVFIVVLTRGCPTFDQSPENPSESPPISNPDEIPLPFTNALIVKVNDSALWARDIDGDNSFFLIKNFAPFHSFDFYRKKNIYFGSTKAGAATSYSKQYSQLAQPGNWSANQIAVDNVHEKVYVLDGLGAKVNVFDITSEYYNILSIYLDQPRDIAVDPIQKYFFVLQVSSILRTNLDGAAPKNILERADISAFQIDANQKRIYCATVRDIQSVDYEGQNFTSVAKIITPAISLAVINSSLFWLTASNDYEKSTLWFCKITNGVCTVTSSAIFDDNAVEIKAYNFQDLQVANPCKSGSNCEHMCINSNDKPKCVCTMATQLKSDSRSCEMIDEFLVYVQGDLIKSRLLDCSQDTFTAAFLPIKLNISFSTRNQVLDFDFDTHSHELIFSDNEGSNKINLKPNDQQSLIGASDYRSRYFNPAVDWVARNVYYIRNPYHPLCRSVVVVQNIEPYDFSTNEKYIYVIDRSYDTVRSIVVHPNRGFLFITRSSDAVSADMFRVNLDGTKALGIASGMNLSISNMENGLAIDYEEDRLLWFDADRKKVHSTDLEGSNVQTIDVSIFKNPVMMNIYGDYLYVSNTTSVWRFHKKTGEIILQIIPTLRHESQLIHGAKIFSAKNQITESNHPCAVKNGGCKRYCFAKPKPNAQLLETNRWEKVCGCNDNEELDHDNMNCISSDSSALESSCGITSL